MRTVTPTLRVHPTPAPLQLVSVWVAGADWHRLCHVPQVVSRLVSEIVLCTKEVNQKTRAAAYALLVGLGQAMHEAAPPPPPVVHHDLDARMGGLGLQPGD